MADTDWYWPYVSFREESSGGGVLRNPKISPDDALNGGRIILLIHGYNDDQHAATASYRGMVALQANPPGKIVGVYWPGDNWENFAFYMQSIGHAVDTAAALAATLRGAAKKLGFIRLNVVAHSMGCRLTLELLRELRAEGDGITIERIALMAAAVATFALEPPSSARARPLRAAFDAFRPSPVVLSLFSSDDPVLKYAFPLGQSLAGEGLFPSALGHALWSDSGAIINPPLTQTQNPGAHHGDYWCCSEKARFAQRKVRDFLDVTGAPPRMVAAATPVSRDAEPGRVTVDPRRIETRDVGSNDWSA